MISRNPKVIPGLFIIYRGVARRVCALTLKFGAMLLLRFKTWGGCPDPPGYAPDHIISESFGIFEIAWQELLQFFGINPECESLDL